MIGLQWWSPSCWTIVLRWLRLSSNHADRVFSIVGPEFLHQQLPLSATAAAQHVVSQQREMKCQTQIQVQVPVQVPVYPKVLQAQIQFQFQFQRQLQAHRLHHLTQQCDSQSQKSSGPVGEDHLVEHQTTIVTRRSMATKDSRPRRRVWVQAGTCLSLSDLPGEKKE